MFVAVLLGFVYGPAEEQHIGCVSIDLYRLYKFCYKRDAMCFVLTDMIQQPLVLDLAVMSSKLDPDCVNFHPQATNPLPRLQFHQVTRLTDIVRVLKDLHLDEEPHVLFYYSGHGAGDEQIRMPSGEQLQFAQIRHAVLSCCWSEAEVIMLADCCGSGAWGMPYKLDLPSRRFRLRADAFAPGPPLPAINTILIASTLGGETALGSEEGSYFTRHLLHCLDKMESLSLTLLIRQVKLAQEQALGHKGVDTAETPTAAAYASFPVPGIIWPWLLQHWSLFSIGADPVSLCITVQL